MAFVFVEAAQVHIELAKSVPFLLFAPPHFIRPDQDYFCGSFSRILSYPPIDTIDTTDTTDYRDASERERPLNAYALVSRLHT